ncbi:hypothetical protein D3C75_1033750 [compost metagenome]
MLSDIPEGVRQSSEAAHHRSGLRLNIVSLLHIPDHGYGQQPPPKGRNDESNLITGGFVHPHSKNQQKADAKGNDAGDIAKSKPSGRNLIHPLILRNIHQKGVIENISSGKTDS